MATRTPTKKDRLAAAATVGKAMSHPLRHELFRIMNDRIASPNECAEELRVSVNDAAYHVRALEKYDCIELVDTKQRRGATEHFYRAIRRSMVSTEDWDAVPPLARNSLTDGFMQPMIDDYTASLEAGIVGQDERFHLTRTPITVDAQGRDRVLEIVEEARQAILEEQAASAGRMSDPASEAIDMSSSHACFVMPS